MIIKYIIIFIVLFSAVLLYFWLAKKYNIIDKPNERSSHNYITIRGGGVVFWLAAILLITNYELRITNYFLLCIIGMTLIAVVSFIDDIHSLPNRIRIVIHFVSITCIFYSLGVFALWTWWLILLAYIFFVGILNAYNFMDGINGITGLYSLIILIALQFVNYQIFNFVIPEFINYAMLACAVFLFFNFRKKAKCFAGDVGSMTIAFWLVTLLLQLVLATHSIVWLMFMAVYGIDTILTILHRIYLKQNIFKAHRLHFYQILCNEKHLSHLLVATVYAIAQLIVCLIIIYVHFYCRNIELISACVILLVLIAVYSLKFRFLQQKIVK